MSLKVNDKSPKTYVILGMHHSGTSFLAKALFDQGVHMGTRRSEHYENVEIVNVNNSLIGDIFDPPPREEIMSKENKLVKNVIKKYQKEMWGFKDPRTSLTADHYLSEIKGDCYVVAVFRKPERVVESLKKKHKIKNPRKLVDHYNENIIQSIRNFLNNDYKKS